MLRWQEWAAIAWLAFLLLTSGLVLFALGIEPDATSAEVLEPPLSAGFLGTDNLGRDVLARVLAGAQVSLSVSVVSVGAALLAGGALGVLAAVRSAVSGEVIMRGMDVLLSFPAIILGLMLALMLGPGYWSVVMVIAVLLTPQFARLVRARLLTELTSGYVQAEIAAGASQRRILTHHVARNMAAPLAAFTALEIADAMIFEAALSFIGIGIQPPTASWGNMLLDGKDVLLSGAWWVIVFPGLALFISILLLTLASDARLSRLGGASSRSLR